MKRQTLTAIGTISMLLFLITTSYKICFVLLIIWIACYYKSGIFKR